MMLMRLYAALWRHAGAWLLLVVLLTLLSTAGLLASLLLPWQLLVALQGNVPARFEWLGREHAVPVIGSLVLFAFALYVVSDWAIGAASRAGANRVLAHHAKTGMFPRYRQHAMQLFASMARAAGAGLLWLLVMILLGLFYPVLALGMLVCLGMLGLGWRLLFSGQHLRLRGWTAARQARGHCCK